jgi:predicted ester cyclase
MADAKAVARRIVNEVMNQGKLTVIDEVVAPDIADHTSPPGVPPGREGFKMFVPAFRAAFPDLHYNIVHDVAEGDVVVEHLAGTGTMKGDFMGMPATGKKAEWNEIHISRIKGDKVVEHWGVVDQLGMLQQLGLAPMPQAAPSR